MIGFDLLRLDGYFTVGSEEIDGVLYVDAELADPQVPECGCDAPKVVKFGPRPVHFRDHPLQRQTVFLRITRQRWRCQNCNSLLLPELPHIDVKRLMTERFCDQLFKDGIHHTFADAAKINGVEETLVRRVFKDRAAKHLADYTFRLPRVLGMDEKVIHGKARFVIGDVENKSMLDLQPSRQQLDLEKYFHQFDNRHEVEVITQDMYWGYKTLNERYFRKATVVIDKFHVVRYANLAVEAVRKSIQSMLDNDGRATMKRKIKLLAARPGRLSDEGSAALKTLRKAHPALDTAITCKEWFYDIYECQTRAEAEAAYDAWAELLPPEMKKPFTPILSFMRKRRWRELVFNYFDHRYTNAYVEGVNSLLERLNQAGRGYDLETLRAKALLRYSKPLIDLYCFDLMSVGAEDQERILNTMVGHGVPVSTFEVLLAGDAFL